MVVQHNLTALGGLFLLLLSVQVATTSKQAAKGKSLFLCQLIQRFSNKVFLRLNCTYDKMREMPATHHFFRWSSMASGFLLANTTYSIKV